MHKPIRIARRRPLLRRGLIAALVLALLPASTGAQTQSPGSGPIRLLVGSPAGGAIDIYARIIMDQMSRSLGVPMLVDNKAGANGNIAAQAVDDGPADGNLIWIGTQSMTEINPFAYTNLRWKLSDFTALIKGVEIPLVLASHPSVPAQSLSELVAWIKRSPGKYGYASYGAGTASHFLGFQLAERFDLDLTHVPYRGSAPQTSDLLGGHALFGFAQIPNVAPYVETKQLTAIAVTGASRSRLLPQIPTLAELGYPDLTASVWFGLFIKRGAPEAVQNRLLSAAKGAHDDPDVRAKLEREGFDISGLTGPEFLAGIEREAERWSRVVKATGFKAED
jgi:tripartite-type tricarboxylate transporter receptor subunit TctC